MQSPTGDDTRNGSLVRTLCFDTVPDPTEQIHRSVAGQLQPNIGLGKAVAPDLPYVRQDVPDDSEAPEVGGRFARLARSRGLLATPPASKGITAYLPAVHAARARLSRAAVVVAVASALLLALLMSTRPPTNSPRNVLASSNRSPRPRANSMNRPRNSVRRPLRSTRHRTSWTRLLRG